MFPIREAEFKKKSIQSIFEPGFTTKKRGWDWVYRCQKELLRNTTMESSTEF
jgi:hypothetical protein